MDGCPWDQVKTSVSSEFWGKKLLGTRQLLLLVTRGIAAIACVEDVSSIAGWFQTAEATERWLRVALSASTHA